MIYFLGGEGYIFLEINELGIDSLGYPVTLSPNTVMFNGWWFSGDISNLVTYRQRWCKIFLMKHQMSSSNGVTSNNISIEYYWTQQRDVCFTQFSDLWYSRMRNDLSRIILLLNFFKCGSYAATYTIKSYFVQSICHMFIFCAEYMWNSKVKIWCLNTFNKMDRSTHIVCFIAQIHLHITT